METGYNMAPLVYANALVMDPHINALFADIQQLQNTPSPNTESTPIAPLPKPSPPSHHLLRVNNDPKRRPPSHHPTKSHGRVYVIFQGLQTGIFQRWCVGSDAQHRAFV